MTTNCTSQAVEQMSAAARHPTTESQIAAGVVIENSHAEAIATKYRRMEEALQKIAGMDGDCPYAEHIAEEAVSFDPLAESEERPTCPVCAAGNMRRRDNCWQCTECRTTLDFDS